MAKKSTLDEFTKSYDDLNRILNIKETYGRNNPFEKIAVRKDLGAMMEELTGEKINLNVENPDVNAETQLMNEFHQRYQDNALNYTKSNLDSIVGSIDSEKLNKVVALSFKHSSEKYEELAGLFKDYSIYLMAEDKSKENEELASAAMSELQLRVLPRLIAKKIEDYMQVSEEEVEKLTGILHRLALRDGAYVNKVLSEDRQRIEEGINKENVKGYIRDYMKEDKDYLGFGMQLYLMPRDKEKKVVKIDDLKGKKAYRKAA